MPRQLEDPMESPSWSRVSEFRTGPRTTITLLQRDFSVVDHEIARDLLPMFDLPSLFELGTAASTAQSVRGRLRSIRPDQGNLCIRLVLIAPAKAEYDWVIEHFRKGILTVWRISDRLDALQVVFRGGKNSMYGQTGGAALMAEFRKTTQEDPSYRTAITKARRLFLQQARRLDATGRDLNDR